MRISIRLCLILFAFSAYSQSYCPSWKWARKIPGSVSSGSAPQAVAADSSGNFFVAGRLWGNTSVGPFSFPNCQNDGYLGKVDSLGQWKWVKKLPKFEVEDAALGPDNKIFLVGLIKDTTNLGSDTLYPSTIGQVSAATIALLDSNGNFIWARAYGKAVVQGVAADLAGNAFVVGYSNHNLSFDSINFNGNQTTGYVARIDSQGNWQWAKAAGKYAFNVASSSSGKTWVAGTFKDTTSFGSTQLVSSGLYENSFLGFIDLGGQWQWAINPHSNPVHIDLAYDHNGSCFAVSGKLSGSCGRIDQSGNWLWQTPLNFQWAGSPAIELSADISGNAFITSSYHNTSGNPAVFGIDTLVATHGGNDMLVTKISSSGAWEWAGELGGPAYDSPTGISAFDERNILVVGAAGGNVIVGLDTLFNSRYFMARISEREPLILTARNDTTISCGDSIRLTTVSNSATKLYYQWSPGKDMNDSTLPDPSVNPAGTTTYSVVATRPNGCTDSASVTITVDPHSKNPNLIFTSSTGDFNYCDSNYTVSAPSGFLTYQWSTGDTTRSIAPPGPGTYTVNLVSSQGCLVEDSVKVSPLSTIVSPGDFYLCHNIPNDSIRIATSTSSVDSVFWSTGQTDPIIWIQNPGKYWFRVWKDSCTYSDTAEVMFFTDTANADFNFQINDRTVSFSPNSDGVVSANWTFGNGYHDNQINTSHHYFNYGTFTVCLAIEDICGYRDTVCKEITLSPVGLGDYEISDVKLYPNPAGNTLTLETGMYSREHSVSEILLFDSKAQLAMELQLIPGTEQKSIDISRLSPGLYFLKLGTEVLKFVKE